MIQISNKNQCSGCTACYTACPKRAITLVPDSLGFKYPVINNILCVDCKVCEKVCPFYQEKKDGAPLRVYAAKNYCIQDLESSRSGGVFPALYKTIIAEGGSVYGALFDDSLNVVHQSADNEESCKGFRGSKYVQSELGNVFQSVVSDLKQGLKVLFSGTPCQVAGLKKVVPPHFSGDLYTVDIICHGTPSPKLYKDYLAYLERIYSSRVVAFNFRDKSVNGWHDHKESAILENGNKIVKNLYTSLFYTNCFFRESCYVCPYASTYRVSDLTLGDLWGWEKIDKDLNRDDKGISLVLINSEKGNDLFELAKDDLKVKEVVMENCLQPNLIRPTKESAYRKELIDYYNKNGFDRLARYVTNPSLLQRIVRKIKRYLIYGKEN